MHFKTMFLSAALAASFMPTTGAAQGIDLASSFIDYTTWNLYGNATVANTTPGNGFTYSTLRLTHPHIGGEAGAGFAPATTSLDFDQAFNIHFFFYTPPGSVANGDGMTFVLTSNDPAMSNLGDPSTGGSNLGYGSSGLNGFAFAIDTFNFGGEPVAPSIQFLENGSNTPVVYTETGLSNISDPSYFQWEVNLEYVPSGMDDGTGMLTGTLSQFVGSLSYSVSYNLDSDALGLYGSDLYYGFTAGSGLADDGHFVSSAMAVPEPETYAMLLAGLGLVGWAARRRMT